MDYPHAVDSPFQLNQEPGRQGRDLARRSVRWRAVLGSVMVLGLALGGCSQPADDAVEPASGDPSAGEALTTESGARTPEPEFFLTRDQTHARFSRDIPPVLTVSSGAVVSVETEEATDGQLSVDSTAADVAKVDFDPIHPLTGPIKVREAQAGDVLKVTLHRIELGDWGWAGIFPGFGFLADEFDQPFLRTFRFEHGQETVEFAPGIHLPLAPFPGVVGVAPDTSDELSTIPPRANGGNMDDRELKEGTVIYLPVFVDGALFSIGDAHAVQGDGEVSGTAIEAPTRIVLQLDVIQNGRAIKEPQYERDDFYAVTAFGETLDEAARKATGYMVDYLADERGLDRTEAYVLASLAGRLKIAEVVDVPHVLVTMKISKRIFTEGSSTPGG